MLAFSAREPLITALPPHTHLMTNVLSEPQRIMGLAEDHAQFIISLNAEEEEDTATFLGTG